MARELSVIYEDIIAAKESDSDFNDLLPYTENWTGLYNYKNFKLLANTILRGLSVSKVAIWRLFAYIAAYAIYYQEQLYDLFKEEVETLIDRSKVGQLPWIEDMTKLFQYGDELVWDGTQYGYETIDTTKQIVTQAASTVASRVITIKAAKGDLGSLTALSADEKTALQYYLVGQNTQFADDGVLPTGTQITLISESSDDLKLAYTIVYDAQVLNSSGQLLSDTSTKPVEDAITDYIQSIPFNSELRMSALTDAIQLAQGVVDVICDAAEARYAATSYVDILATTKESYSAYAGYLAMAPNFGLDGFFDYPTNTIKTLTYVEDE